MKDLFDDKNQLFANYFFLVVYLKVVRDKRRYIYDSLIELSSQPIKQNSISKTISQHNFMSIRNLFMIVNNSLVSSYSRRFYQIRYGI